jgi:cell division protein FtsB
MMRSPYQSPPKPPRKEPTKRFLRLPPPEARRKHRGLWIGALALAAYLAWSYVGSDSGIFRIATLKRETDALKQKKAELALRVDALELRRKAEARDPLLEERVARERFHLVKKDEILYRYKDADRDTL